MKLYEHELHPHAIYNANRLHEREQMQGGFNTKFAILLTRSVSTMWATYLFAVLALVGLFGLLGFLNPFSFLLTTWISQQFLQLVFLPILSVSQSVLGRKQEIQAEEQFKTTQNSFHDIEEIVQHLDVQDQKIVEILEGIHALSAQVILLTSPQEKKPAPRAKKIEVVK